MVGKALSPLAPLCKGELLLQCEALPTIEGLLTEVSEKRKGCGRKAIPPAVARILSGDSTSPLTREASVVVRGEGIVRSGGHGGVMWSLLKHYCFTTGHHFDECRKLNIKNPLFNANGGFFVLENFVSEGQARSPTKSEWDSV